MSRRTRGRRRTLAPATLAMVTVAALALGCAVGDAPGEPRVAFLLPESETARYETHDRPAFERRLHELCPGCVAITGNAGGDAQRQQAQAEAALTNGADVLVLGPVDSVAAAVIARQAAAAGVPVISYDRMILDAPVAFHVGFDNERVGALQAQSLVAAIGDRIDTGQVVVLNGAATDANAPEFRTGAGYVFDAAGVDIGVEVDVPDWSPDRAQEVMERAVSTLGRDRIVGVYSANDAMAAGAIAAMRSAGIRPLPPVTGQDAELAAIRRIVAAEQHMTVYKSFDTQARVAAEIALVLARGQVVPDGVSTGVVDNGAGRVPVLRLEPAVVTGDRIARTVIADGLWTREQICRGQEAACRELGL